MNTSAFYQWQFECTEIPWWERIGVPFICCHHLIFEHDNAQRYRDEIPFSCHSSAAITSYFSMIMHGPIWQGSVHNFWELKMSQFFHGLHTHQICHPLSMFGMLWIDVHDSVFQFQFLPISSKFAQPSKRSGTTFHRSRSTAWSTLCEGDVSRCMRQMVFTLDTDWSTPLPFFEGIWPTDVYLYSQSCEIHRLGPN